MPTLVDFRSAEFDLVGKYFGPGIRVLEIGGGNGYQASLIASTGSAVESVDIEKPTDTERLFFDVQLYDGEVLPFPSGHFDIVYSSNVLEHVPHLGRMLLEIYRVLKPSGLAIHILPTPIWRGYTSLAHYVHIASKFSKIVKSNENFNGNLQSAPKRVLNERGWRQLVMRVLMDGPHGEYSSAVAELWYFSRWRWLRVFKAHHFECIEDFACNLLYTGYGVLPSVTVAIRQRLAKYLGSSTRAYILKKRS